MPFRRSVDAALGFVVGADRCPADFAQDLLLALGVVAETAGAPPRVHDVLRAALVEVRGPRTVPTRQIVDCLLELRSAADGGPNVDGDR